MAGDGDESQWEAFIPDEDEWDPEPDPGDFWIENDGADQQAWGRRRGEGGWRLLSPVSPSSSLLA